MLALVPLVGFARQSVLALRQDYTFQRSMNFHVDPQNEGVRFLDVIHWFETGVPNYELMPLLAVSGRRVNEPFHLKTVSWLYPRARQHFEVWWLDDVQLSSVRFLIDQASLPLIAAGCSVSWFDGARFAPLDGASARVEPFRPDPGEPSPLSGEAWWTLPMRSRTRAIRLSCEGLPSFVRLGQVEALGRDASP